MQCIIDDCERKGDPSRGGRCQRCYAERSRVNNSVQARPLERRATRDLLMAKLAELALGEAVDPKEAGYRINAANTWLRHELEGSDDDSLDALRLRIDNSLEYAVSDTEEESPR